MCLRYLQEEVKEKGRNCDSKINSSTRENSSCSKKSRWRLADSSAFESDGGKREKLKQAEESLRIVMFLSCWAPN